MAKWKVSSKTGGSLTGGIDYDSNGSRWNIQQDIQPFLDQAKEDRAAGHGNGHYRKAFTVPDVVAIEINMKWGIDIHCPTFMSDTEKKAKLFTIIDQYYPHLKSTEGKF